VAVDTSIDVGCGSYSVHIDKPATPLKLKSQQCHGYNDFGSHGDISPDSQDYWAKWWCGNANTNVNLGPGKALQWDPSGVKGANMHYKVSWLDGCKTTVDSQSVHAPVDGADCYTLIRNDFLNCKSFHQHHYHQSNILDSMADLGQATTVE
jgi:hypothetical protein